MNARLQRVDLYRAERSNVERSIVDLVYSPAFRRSLTFPVMMVVFVVGCWTFVNVGKWNAQANLSNLQQQYKKVQAAAADAKVTNDNYDQLKTLAASITTLRRSVIYRAQEITDIGNVIVRHRLHVETISDMQATESSNPTWDLTGPAVDQSSTMTCEQAVAAALPDFLRIKHIESAIPQHATRRENTAHICDYDLRLARSDDSTS